MQTMFWINKLGKMLVCLMLGLGVMAYASAESTWISNNKGQVYLQMADGAAFTVELGSEVKGVFYDRVGHKIGSHEYISLFQVSPSNPSHPSGACGAGNEVWLYVYQVIGTALIENTQVLVSSCLRSISMASQNTGGQMQDFDFSSVRWTLQGFSIEWFEPVNAGGRSSQLSSFVWDGRTFLPQDVLSQESPHK
jgi:hypothetical protein